MAGFDGASMWLNNAPYGSMVPQQRMVGHPMGHRESVKTVDVVLEADLLATFCRRGRRRLRDIQSSSQTVLKLDRCRGVLKVTGTDRAIMDVRRQLESLGGPRRPVQQAVWAELMRTRTLETTSRVSVAWLQQMSGCRVHIERTQQQVRLFGPKETVAVADRLLAELESGLCASVAVPVEDGHSLPSVSLQLLAHSCGITLQIAESEILVLGLVAAVEEAAEELSRFVQDPSNFQLRREPDAAVMAAAAAAASAPASAPSNCKGTTSVGSLMTKAPASAMSKALSFATTSVGSLMTTGDFSGGSSHSADDESYSENHATANGVLTRMLPPRSSKPQMQQQHSARTMAPDQNSGMACSTCGVPDSGSGNFCIYCGSPIRQMTSMSLASFAAFSATQGQGRDQMLEGGPMQFMQPGDCNHGQGSYGSNSGMTMPAGMMMIPMRMMGGQGSYGPNHGMQACMMPASNMVQYQMPDGNSTHQYQMPDGSSRHQIFQGQHVLR
ncbi:unnamed protein product [Polarella glacialis]|uniref:Uncharacterized protein n=1 Tax=Polarella glacialis TaxID=89957 RepID=A0A813IES0_POLGL|nr:unnamed protein product [Polarella glacialis]